MTTENRAIPVAVNRLAPNGEGRTTDETGEAAAQLRQAFTPLIDIHDGPDGLILEADVPGAAENEITIALEDNVLNLHAHVAATVPDGCRLLHEEYRHGDFQRTSF